MIEPTVKIPFSIWSSIFILAITIIFLMQFGYIYIAKLNENDEKMEKLEREQLILNEIYWFDIWLISYNSPHRIYLDTANKYFKNSLDSILKRVSIFNSYVVESIVDSVRLYLDSIINSTWTKSIKININANMKNLQRSQKKLEQKVFELRSKEWEPKLDKVAKSAFIPILCYGLILFFILITIRYFYRGISELKTSPFRIFAVWIPGLFILITYITMAASGRINPTDSPFSIFRALNTFAQNMPIFGVFKEMSHIMIIICYVFLIFLGLWYYGFIKNNLLPLFKWLTGATKANKNDLLDKVRKSYAYSEGLKRFLDKIILLFLGTLSILCLYSIINGASKEIYGVRFYPPKITKLIIAESQKIEFLSLEISISMMVLIIALFFMFFPIIITSTCKEKTFNIGWSNSYHYFIKGIFTQKNVEFTLGLLGSIGILLTSFLFTSANCFALQIFINNYWWIMAGISLMILVSLLITFVAKFIYYVICFIGFFITFGILKAIYNISPQFINYIAGSSTIMLTLLIIFMEITQPRRKGMIDIKPHYYVIFVIFSGILISIYFVFPQLKSTLFFWAFQLQTQDIPYHFIKPAALIIVISFLILWLQPVVSGTQKIDTIFFDRTASILRRILMELKDHTIVFGYGDLGLKVGRGIVKRFINPQKGKHNFAEIYSTRRRQVLKVCRDIVVVDKTTATFDETYPDDIYDNIGICDIDVPHYKEEIIKMGLVEISDIEKLSNIVFLGIKGNCVEPGIQDKVNLETSQCVILSARDDTATFPIFNEVYKLHQEKKRKGEVKSPRAILGAERSLYGGYLEWRCVDETIYFIFPSQLRGITVGEIISDDMINQTKGISPDRMREYIKRRMKVMILGEGNKLYYILQTLNEDLKRFLFDAISAEKFMEKNVLLISKDEFIKQNAERRYKHKAVWKVRSSAIGLTSSPAKELLIQVAIKDPSLVTVLTPIIKKEKPHIVVIAAMTPEDTIGIVHEVLLTFEKINQYKDSGKCIFPHIIVGSRRIEWNQIRDAVVCWRTSRFRKNSLYPIQEVDTVVDYYDDAAQMMLGLYDTIQDKNSRPIEITDCAMNIPGILGEITAFLAGLKFAQLGQITSPQKIPNFHNYRSVNIGSANFSELIRGKEVSGQALGYCFFSGATLEEKDIKILSDDVKKSPRSGIIGATENNLDLVSNLIFKLGKDSFFTHQGCTKDVKKCKKEECFIEKTCPRRRLCPIDNFRRHLEVADKKTKAEHKLHYFCNPPDYTTKYYQGNRTIRFETYAQIALCGYGSESPGAMARAINLLLFRDLDSNNNKKPTCCLPSYILDITYTRSFGCYCPEKSYQKIYGKIIDNPFLKSASIEYLQQNAFINSLLIRPTRQNAFDDWLDFAQKLCKSLNLLTEQKYRLYKGRSKFGNVENANQKEYEMILLFRFNKEYLEQKSFGYFDYKPCENDWPNLFLYLLRGKGRKLGKCLVRETTCPFEKIKDEAERYGIDWKDVTPN